VLFTPSLNFKQQPPPSTVTHKNCKWQGKYSINKGNGATRGWGCHTSFDETNSSAEIGVTQRQGAVVVRARGDARPQVGLVQHHKVDADEVGAAELQKLLRVAPPSRGDDVIERVEWREDGPVGFGAAIGCYGKMLTRGLYCWV
jgi:hypothetical protein